MMSARSPFRLTHLLRYEDVPEKIVRHAPHRSLTARKVPGDPGMEEEWEAGYMVSFWQV